MVNSKRFNWLFNAWKSINPFTGAQDSGTFKIEFLSLPEKENSSYFGIGKLFDVDYFNQWKIQGNFIDEINGIRALVRLLLNYFYSLWQLVWWTFTVLSIVTLQVVYLFPTDWRITRSITLSGVSSQPILKAIH